MAGTTSIVRTLVSLDLAILEQQVCIAYDEGRDITEEQYNMHYGMPVFKIVGDDGFEQMPIYLDQPHQGHGKKHRLQMEAAKRTIEQTGLETRQQRRARERKQK